MLFSSAGVSVTLGNLTLSSSSVVLVEGNSPLGVSLVIPSVACLTLGSSPALSGFDFEDELEVDEDTEPPVVVVVEVVTG